MNSTGLSMFHCEFHFAIRLLNLRFFLDDFPILYGIAFTVALVAKVKACSELWIFWSLAVCLFTLVVKVFGPKKPICSGNQLSP